MLLIFCSCSKSFLNGPPQGAGSATINELYNAFLAFSNCWWASTTI